MNLQDIKKHYEDFQAWLLSLKELDDHLWYAPIEEGKWSIAANISHLLFWDKYSFTERFPNFKQGASLPPFPSIQEVNNSAAEYAHSGMTKEKLLNEILLERQSYFDLIDRYDETTLDQQFSIGDHSLTIREYFEDFIGHDSHHQKQINEIIKSV